jgi:glucosamine 6-phosphate synthetase-like amidotransferase/phosphosugar isomerase protein
MIVGLGQNGVFLSSDINAVSNVAVEFTTLEDNETVVIKNGSYDVFAL